MQRFATMPSAMRGCTYPSSTRIKIGYTTAIGQTPCICAETSFLIRRSNNSGGNASRASDARRSMRSLSRPVPRGAGWGEIEHGPCRRQERACRASRARRSDAPCPASVTEFGVLAYQSGREARRSKGQRERMSVSGALAARPGYPERLLPVRLSNLARRKTARPPRTPSSS